LKKNIQRGLILRALFHVANWVRLLSPTFARSDLAAEYYDRHIFEGGTFGDIAARKGPFIIMNATDMTHGTRVGFTQEAFDLICSDLSLFPVGRAAAASSAIPMALTPSRCETTPGPAVLRQRRDSKKSQKGVTSRSGVFFCTMTSSHSQIVKKNRIFILSTAGRGQSGSEGRS